MFDKYRANSITRNYNEDDLKIENVLNIYFEATNRCNLNCLFCARENIEYSV